MIPRSVIFGAGGQDGFFLNKSLLSQGHKVYPCFHHENVGGYKIDVADYFNVRNLIKDIKPDYIFHLAARSSTSHEFILENHKAIVDGTLNILESAETYTPNAKIFLASSGLIFKNSGAPIKDDDEHVAQTAYTLTRIEAVHIARYYRQRGRNIFIGYLFNHESHLRHPDSIARKVARSVAKIHLGIDKSIVVGNASVIKEWMWAGDAVEAILKFVNQNEVFELCIGDGVGRSIRDYSDACCKAIGISSDDYLYEIPNYAVETPILVSNSSKIHSLGWQPQMNLAALAKHMVRYEISTVRKDI
jgi:GDPmannose 4,6-dehydratase